MLDFITSIFTLYSIPVLDVQEAFSEYPAETLRAKPGDIEHPNALGNRIIAVKGMQLILNHLRGMTNPPYSIENI